MSEKLGKRNRLRKKEFAETYVHNSSLFFDEIPTKAEISRAYNHKKSIGKKKRVKPKREPEMSKEENVEMLLRNSELLGEIPNEEEANRWSDLTVFQRKYDAIRGRTKKQTEEKKAAFFDVAEQEIMSRYSRRK